MLEERDGGDGQRNDGKRRGIGWYRRGRGKKVRHGGRAEKVYKEEGGKRDR